MSVMKTLRWSSHLHYAAPWEWVYDHVVEQEGDCIIGGYITNIYRSLDCACCCRGSNHLGRGTGVCHWRVRHPCSPRIEYVAPFQMTLKTIFDGNDLSPCLPILICTSQHVYKCMTQDIKFNVTKDRGSYVWVCPPFRCCSCRYFATPLPMMMQLGVIQETATVFCVLLFFLWWWWC